MALIVETGTGASDSESYASAADALAYHSARGNATWSTITTAQQEEALRRATDYIEQVYDQAWQGLQINSTQALSFPRHSVYINGWITASDAIPKQLINATCELALRAAAGELLSDLERGVLREKVGALEVEYDRFSPEIKRYPVIEKLVKPLLQNPSNSSVGLNRV